MNRSYPPTPALAGEPSLGQKLQGAAVWARDTLDQGGRPLWLATMIAAFVIAPPVGFAILFYMLWSKRMFSSCRTRRHDFEDRREERRARWAEARWGERRPGRPASSGNAAFDAYREETLRRLEDEHEQFMGFLGRLREARDKAEFDQFMAERAKPAASPDQPDEPARA